MDYEEVLQVLMTIDLTFDGARKKRNGASEIQCVNITILSDEKVEFDETFYVVLSTEDPDVCLIPQNATVIITNNDGKPLYCVNFILCIRRTVHIVSYLFSSIGSQGFF